MLVSTKGRYALRVMVDLAEHAEDGRIPLKQIATRQGISEKYLENILSSLVRVDLLSGLRGKGGGYQLTRDAGDITIGEVLRITEGSLAPVACLESEHRGCEHAATCRTVHVWRELDDLITGYLDGVTIADLVPSGVDADAAAESPACPK
ncbi:MAG: Rrf2 family transcriptional regulator [Coriobacteriaceae bacterium]|nr:Rrf2 family transcriptional regulator [Coriobacteriaceae bacterium]